ncbi:phosphopentomutase [Erysipelothrix sp. HDW6A]|uniref:phosphopentomutase n=1 Tax=Erysipelothrix sp. HDW6A TaxID=2714928 RepID=UPI001409F5B7|nr:phosphopentomutase [Erysipelothrix sp. HDW6A]QIK57512.1 phosphopentomutase [Erysipelothrix sp. HDW6A]
MSKYNRIITIVMDSVGAGAAHDAEKFGDLGSDTLGHIAERMNGLNMPNMKSLGLGNLHKILGVDPVEAPKAYYTKMIEASNGKDTMTGHWEMMGLNIQKPFITFTETGFPKELLDELSERTGYGIIGNKSASGTEILDELGEEHMATKDMIVYTSADSVLQIAAHEEVFGLDELYRVCEIARELTMKDEWKVGRVIARPFIGTGKGKFQRTANRHDYALKPFGKTALDSLKEGGYDVISVGKIVDIFDNEGITDAYRTKSNHHGMEETIRIVRDMDFNGLLFVNLVDFDALYGHRRNPIGYGEALEEFDGQLGELLPLIKEDDLLIITADHGNDPVHAGTDHTREEVPVLYYSPSLKGMKELEKNKTFADIGATITDNFEVEPTSNGKSVLKDLI